MSKYSTEEYRRLRRKSYQKMMSEDGPRKQRYLTKKRECEVKYKERLKHDVLSMYGTPKGYAGCSWPNCEEDDIDVLTLDHINDDGHAERRMYPDRQGGTTTYQMLRKLGYPPGYQTLCANHQLKKDILRRRECRKA